MLKKGCLTRRPFLFRRGLELFLKNQRRFLQKATPKTFSFCLRSGASCASRNLFFDRPSIRFHASMSGLEASRKSFPFGEPFPGPGTDTRSMVFGNRVFRLSLLRITGKLLGYSGIIFRKFFSEVLSELIGQNILKAN